LEEQYLPRHAGDRIAVSACGKAVSIADKLDTLVGVFGIGQIPTGDEDPFGLRRAALGAARTLIEGEFPMDLEQALLWACEGYAKPWNRAELLPKAFDFVMQRLRAWYQDLSVPMDVFEAVLARRPTCPLDFHRRVAAVQAFTQLPEAPSLAAATKRVANILRRSSSPIATLYDDGLLQEPAELQLAEELAAQKQAVAPLIERAEYTLMLQKLALLRSPVDRFFDEVLVMADDPDLRANRLALLQQLQVLFLQVADISRLTL
jgi:glycyl-tRNA synthetase beta chain